MNITLDACLYDQHFAALTPVASVLVPVFQPLPIFDWLFFGLFLSSKYIFCSCRFCSPSACVLFLKKRRTTCHGTAPFILSVKIVDKLPETVALEHMLRVPERLANIQRYGLALAAGLNADFASCLPFLAIVFLPHREVCVEGFVLQVRRDLFRHLGPDFIQLAPNARARKLSLQVFRCSRSL